MRVVIDDNGFTAVADNNAGYDVTMMMHGWDDANWYWWAYQVKRLGLQGKISGALAKWDDDNSTGTVKRAAETV